MCSLGSNTESPEECDKESDFKIWIFKFLGKVLHKPETRRPGKRERTNEDTVMHPEEGVKADLGGHLQHHFHTQMILQFILCVAVLKVWNAHFCVSRSETGQLPNCLFSTGH